jgi:excinuclease ABC subunit C
VLSFREGLLMYKRHFLFKRELWQMATSGLETIVIQYYQRTGQEPPEQIILPQERTETAQLLTDWFKAERDLSVQVISPVKGKKVALVNMAEKNARLYLAQKILPNAEEDLRDLQKILNLPRMPHVIEAFDISNLGETNAVAGMVQFRDGAPSKANYRRFKIRTVEGQNDFAMMMEAVTRRLTRLAEEKKDFPDLLLIDGGKGQLHAAMQALPGFEQPPMIISLAKKEETLFSPWLEEGVNLPSNHPVRRLVERIRDEVHHWAVSYHRQLRDATYRHSALEKVEGLGPKRSSLLLRHFGSLRRVREAPVEEIARLKGFSVQLAQKIQAQLSSEQPAPPPRPS